MNGVKFLSEDFKLISKVLNTLYYVGKNCMYQELTGAVGNEKGGKAKMGIILVTLIHPKDGKVKKSC
ncbi:MAG: hypothetical protein ACXQTW_07495 [Candidatus Methanospirareceae archaeon]